MVCLIFFNFVHYLLYRTACGKTFVAAQCAVK
jgi:hypothetical protein